MKISKSYKDSHIDYDGDSMNVSFDVIQLIKGTDVLINDEPYLLYIMQKNEPYKIMVYAEHIDNNQYHIISYLDKILNYHIAKTSKPKKSDMIKIYNYILDEYFNSSLYPPIDVKIDMFLNK